MGGGRKQQQQREWKEWRDGREQRDGKWHYWQGSRKQSYQEMRYDQMEVATPSASASQASMDVPMETWDASSSGTALMLAVQKTLTAGRKAEGRARKLKEEILKKENQWQAYVKTVRARYSAQKKQFNGDLQKLQQDLQAAVDHSQAAAQQVIQLINGEIGPATEEEVPEDDGWDALVAQAEPANRPGDFMQIALLAAQAMQRTGLNAGAAATGRPTQMGPAPPGQPAAPAVPAPAPAVTYSMPPPGLPAPAAMEVKEENPFPPSPSTNTLPSGISPGARKPAPKEGPRRPIKTRTPPATGATAGPSLGQKLLEKRQSILATAGPMLPGNLPFDPAGELRAVMEGHVEPIPTAMHPFRTVRPPESSTAFAEGALRPSENGGTETVSLDSDGDIFADGTE